MRHAAWALLIALALSGCTDAPVDGDGPAPSDTPGGDDLDPQVAAGTYVEWDLGDHWDFDLTVRGFDAYDQTRLLYYQRAGEEFTVGTPHYDEALHHALFDFNPLLGRIHSNLLSPHERGEHTFMFPFHRAPVIRDGDEWTTTFYGRSLTVRAAYDGNISTPDGPRPGYRFTATDPNDADFRATYSYVRDVKWFTYLTVQDADGAFVDLRLTQHAGGGTGPAHFIRAKDYLDETLETTNPLPVSTTFTVSEADVEDRRVESFAIAAQITPQSGLGGTLRLLAPNGTTIWEGHPDGVEGPTVYEIWPTGAKSDLPLIDRPQWPAGTYTLEFGFTGQASAHVRIVGTQDNSGRL